jgi:hypothetical protein
VNNIEADEVRRRMPAIIAGEVACINRTLAGTRPNRQPPARTSENWTVVAGRSFIAYWPLTDSGEPAANLSGETFAELAEVKVGEGGEVSWGGGVPLPSDSSGGVVLKMRDLDNWSYLRSTATLPLPATWAISVHFTPTYDSAGYGTVIEVGDDNRHPQLF